jgi:hypothetical protein
LIRRVGGVVLLLHAFLISALDGLKWAASHPGPFTLGERAPGTHWIGDWVWQCFKVFIILVGKPERKIPLGRPRRKWEDNIRMDLKEIRGGKL